MDIPTHQDAIKFGKDFGAGAVAAVVAKTVIAPIERVKLILQLQTAQSTISVDKRYKGMVDCLLRLPREQGFLSFWRGNLSNVFRAGSQESLGMAFKELFKIWCLKGVDAERQYARFAAGNLLAGGLAGCSTFFFIYPLDFTRTRLAVDMGKDATSREFRGLVDCFVKIARHDGLFGLYRGFLPSLSYIFIYRSSYYGIFDSLKLPMRYSPLYPHDPPCKSFALFSRMSRTKTKGENEVSFPVAFFMGQISALVAAMISYPLDTVRRRLMMQSGKKVRDYNGTLDCARKIYRVEGLNAFFSGFFVNAIRGVGAALVLALYNDISKHL